ncbi:hypothetical protein, partial [Streptomyces sp. SID3343]|uniref:hypothetical protein n=1 Tax=Streptomyces sp. SID3343 TaxID=2690260 RepID=UPI0013C1CD47
MSEATRPMFKYGNTPMVPLSGDFDGSGSDEAATYDPRTSTFYMGDTSILFGNPGDRPVVGRWDGGADLVGVYRPQDSTFYLRHADGSVTSFKYGNGGNWVPVAGDWDGNGTETVGLFNPDDAHFYLRDSLSQGVADRTVWFGNTGDVPIVGDWDGTGRTNVGVYQPDLRKFNYRHDTDDNVTTQLYGDRGDTPVVGDWDGNHTTTPGVV